MKKLTFEEKYLISKFTLSNILAVYGDDINPWENVSDSRVAYLEYKVKLANLNPEYWAAELDHTNVKNLKKELNRLLNSSDTHVPRPYYTLIGKDVDTKKWIILFGDYSRKVVTDEKIESYADDYTVSGLAIIETGEAQEDINAELNKVNGER